MTKIFQFPDRAREELERQIKEVHHELWTELDKQVALHSNTDPLTTTVNFVLFELAHNRVHISGIVDAIKRVAEEGEETNE